MQFKVLKKFLFFLNNVFCRFKRLLWYLPTYKNLIVLGREIVLLPFLCLLPIFFTNVRCDSSDIVVS